jgi:hypothetical protein
MPRILAAFALLATGCVAVPPPAPSGALGGCHPGAYMTRSELPCARDDDCLLCGGPSGCRLTSRERVMLTNAPCPAPDPEECRGASARCCGGRCVLSQGPPPL